MIRRLAPMLTIVVATLALATGSAYAESGWSLFELSPEGISTYAGDVDGLYKVILWLITGTFVLTEGLLVAFLFLYRARPGGRAVYTHGNHRLEMVWTIVPGAILFALALYQIGTWRNIKVLKPGEGEGPVVQLMARQFEWHFRYPGPDGVFNTADDITTLNFLHVPVNEKVTIQIRGQDVLHSFFVPVLRLKQDTVPGLTITQWFEATKTTEEYREVWKEKLLANRDSYVAYLQHQANLAAETEAAKAEREGDGDSTGVSPKYHTVTDAELDAWIAQKVESFNFEIACAELCGAGHTRMRGFMVVHDADGYWKWMNEEYLKTVEYGVNEETPFFKKHEGGETYWPQGDNRKDPWTAKNWPEELKKSWPKEGE